jgi:hybrid cluster-associated redox disulfide protein
MTSARSVSANDTIEVLLTRHPRAARVLVDHGMHCAGCAIAPFETIGEACAIYGVSVKELLAALDRPPDAERTATS